MALTNIRWIAAAVCGCLIAMAGILAQTGKKAWTPDHRDNLMTAMSRAEYAVTVASERLIRMHLRDSVLSSLGRGRGAAPRFVVSAEITQTMTNPMRSLQERVAQTRPSSPKVPVDVVLLADHAPAARGAPTRSMWPRLTLDYLLPRNAGERCIAIARLKTGEGLNGGRQAATGRLEGDDVARRLVGPCSYYEHFGMPGAQIDTWLRNGAWTFGRIGVNPWEYPKWNGEGWWQKPGPLEQAGGFPLRGYVGPLGFSCASGNANACSKALSGARDASRQRRVRLLADDVLSLGIAEDRPATVFGPSELSFLAEMVRSIGPTKFEKFWTSPLEPQAAFKDATGVEMGQWATQWMTRSYGEMHSGPAFAGPGASWITLLALVSLAGAVVAANRRRMTA